MKDGTQWKDGKRLKVCAFNFRVGVREFFDRHIE